jgi:hypothetical protein
MTGKKGIGFRENQDTQPHGDRTAVVLHNEEHGNARSPVQRAAAVTSQGSHRQCAW